MLSNPLEVTLGSDDLELKMINEGDYSSEYFLRNAYYEVRFRIRHSKESGSATAKGLDRHNVEITKRVYSTPTVPEKIFQSYLVIRNHPDTDGTDAASVTAALRDILTDPVITQIVGWESQ